jgi:hypothetical protein
MSLTVSQFMGLVLRWLYAIHRTVELEVALYCKLEVGFKLCHSSCKEE